MTVHLPSCFRRQVGALLATSALLILGCDQARSSDADAKRDAEIICPLIRIVTNAQAAKLAKRPTRAARGDSDEAFAADLLAQAEISGATADEMRGGTKDPELQKVLADLAAYHRSTEQRLRQLAAAVKAGDKAKEKQLQAGAEERAKQQTAALDAFEAHCTKHGVPATN